jgi:hypothetical protein
MRNLILAEIILSIYGIRLVIYAEKQQSVDAQHQLQKFKEMESDLQAVQSLQMLTGKQ